VALEEEAAGLYGVPLEEFTARRNARAKELKVEDRELADAVGRLPKPAVAASAVNRLARERRDLLDALLELAGELRAAQSSGDGARLRALTGEAHAAVRQVLAAAGGLGDAQLDQVEQTLRAAMADEGAAAAVRAGVLVKPLAPAGFGSVDLTGAVAVDLAAPETAPVTRKRHLSVVRPAGDARRERAAVEEKRRAKQANEVRLAAERALDALEAARAELASTVEAVRHAEQERDAAVARVDHLRSDLHQAEERAASADAAVRAAGRALDRAERNERAAMSAAEAARKDLEALS